MRNMIAALAVGFAGLGFALTAQAAPATSLAPLTTLNQSSIQQVAYCRYGYHRVCTGYGYERRCYCKREYH